MTLYEAQDACLRRLPVIYSGNYRDIEYQEIVAIMFNRRKDNKNEFSVVVTLKDYCGHSTITASLDQIKLKNSTQPLVTREVLYQIFVGQE